MVVTIKDESQDVQVLTGVAAKTIQAKKTEVDAMTIDNSCLSNASGQCNR